MIVVIIYSSLKLQLDPLQFKKLKPDCPLIAVPSTYSKVKEIELIKNGFQIVIYANNM